jgi:hypothetical protein
VQQQTSALHVAQEQRAEAGAIGRPFDEAGDVGDHEALEGFDADHAEVRVQRGERVVRHLRRRRRNSADEGALAGVREAEQADVGEQLQLEAQLALLARPTWRRLARRAVHRGLEVDVALAAVAALGDQQALAVLGEVADDLVGGDVADGEVPTGTRMMTSSPALPYMSRPMPFCPRCAR